MAAATESPVLKDGAFETHWHRRLATAVGFLSASPTTWRTTSTLRSLGGCWHHPQPQPRGHSTKG